MQLIHRCLRYYIKYNLILWRIIMLRSSQGLRSSQTAPAPTTSTPRPDAFNFSKHEKRLTPTELCRFLKDIVQYYNSKGITIKNSDFLNGGVLSMHQLFQRIDTLTPSADKERLRHEYTQFRCVREGVSVDVMKLESGSRQWLQIDPSQSIEDQKQSTYLIPRQNGEPTTTGAVIYKSDEMYRIYDPGNNKHEPYTQGGETIHPLDLKTLDQTYRSDSSKGHPVKHFQPTYRTYFPAAPVRTGTDVPPATLGLPGYGGWDDAGRQSCTRKLQEYFSKNRVTGINQLRPTSRLPYQKDLKSLQQSVQVHIRPDSTMKTNDVGRWLKQKQYYDPILDSQIKENAMDVVLTGSMKQFYDYDENTPAASRDLTKNPRDFEFMYNVMPNFQKQNRHLNRPEGAHYNQVFENSGHLKSGYEGTMKTLFKRSFTTMMYACTKHYEATKRNGFTSFEFPVQMPNAFFDGFDDERVEIDGISYNGKDIAKRIFAKALHEFLVETTLPEGCSGVTTIGFGGHSSHLNHANVRHSNANSLHYYDAAKKANVQCLVPIMGDEHSRMMNGAFDNGAEQAAEENISRQTLGQPAMLLCPVNNPLLVQKLGGVSKTSSSGDT